MDAPKPTLFARVTGYVQGRHTAFVLAFFLAGHVMHWYHRLDATYIAYMGTLMGFVLGHSIKEDKMGGQQPPQQ